MRDGNRKSKAQVELKIIMTARSLLSAISAAKKELEKIVACYELIIFSGKKSSKLHFDC